MLDKLVCSNISLSLKKLTLSIDFLELDKGFIYSIIGSNGTGKSTLLNILLGNRSHKSWELNGFENTAYVPSDVECLDNFNRKEITRLFQRSNKKFDKALFINYLFTFKLSGFDDYEDLSKGEKKCVLLSLALASQPKVLVLDELSNGVDIHSRSLIYNCIMEYIGTSDNTVIYASNQVEDVLPITDYFLFMGSGKVSSPISVVDIIEKYKVINLSLDEFQSYAGKIYSYDQNFRTVKAIVDRKVGDDKSDSAELITILGGGISV